MNALVTGATGFIGKQLTERLLDSAHRVTALVRAEADASVLPGGVGVARGDVRDYVSVERAVAGCDTVFHLAAKTESLELPKAAIWSVNVEGTANVALACVRHRIKRLVFASSVGVYGRAIDNLSINETTQPKPDSPYGESKLTAERILLSHHERDALPLVIARISSVLGPGARAWRPFFQSVASGYFRCIGAGRNHHHTADVADIAEGLLLCATVPNVEGRTYVLAGGEPVELREFARLVADEFGGRQRTGSWPAWPLYVFKPLNQLAYALTGRRLPRADRIDFFLGNRAFDISRARRELGYAPRITMREAVARTVASFRITTGFVC
ncbi:MAG TPA: NAD-dependent epimerase/dehydratase family protein [Candidatus Eisenbacteria bacterium]|nr:NAD-dependent epimerase/dehydratase family protein [Candidatus Eisenbacteria bacterium]